MRKEILDVLNIITFCCTLMTCVVVIFGIFILVLEYLELDLKTSTQVVWCIIMFITSVKVAYKINPFLP